MFAARLRSLVFDIKRPRLPLIDDFSGDHCLSSASFTGLTSLEVYAIMQENKSCM